MTLTASPPHCDARATGRTVTAWGFESLPCMTSVGLRSFMDREGIARRYCSVPEHKANVERRFGAAPATCRFCHKALVGDDWLMFDDKGALFAVCGQCADKADES